MTTEIATVTGVRTDELQRVLHVRSDAAVLADGGALFQPAEVRLRWRNGTCGSVEVRGRRLHASGKPSRQLAGAVYTQIGRAHV